MKTVISTNKAPAAIGPYSQAIKVDNTIYLSGMIPVNPESGVIPEGIKEQATQVLENIKGLLESQNAGMENIVKTTVFIQSMDDFATINEVYAGYFSGAFPARSCVEVSKLPKGVLIEIESIAVV